MAIRDTKISGAGRAGSAGSGVVSEALVSGVPEASRVLLLLALCSLVPGIQRAK